MYLFILESIGTSELLLIGLVALIFFGPRKLPDFARSLGKIMNEFRRSSNEFKQTWEREVASEVNQLKEETSFTSVSQNSGKVEESIEKNSIAAKKTMISPEIKELSEEDFQAIKPKENLEIQAKTETEETLTSKQNWL
ncbi:MAG: twin-arginine translocase TatA/TatE family subunit [Pyrinomonadaceae bacterium]